MGTKSFHDVDTMRIYQKPIANNQKTVRMFIETLYICMYMYVCNCKLTKALIISSTVSWQKHLSIVSILKILRKGKINQHVEVKHSAYIVVYSDQ